MREHLPNRAATVAGDSINSPAPAPPPVQCLWALSLWGMFTLRFQTSPSLSHLLPELRQLNSPKHASPFSPPQMRTLQKRNCAIGFLERASQPVLSLPPGILLVLDSEANLQPERSSEKEKGSGRSQKQGFAEVAAVQTAGHHQGCRRHGVCMW